MAERSGDELSGAAHDVIVVGAGPGGLMAAQRLAESGRSVTLLDHKVAPARKFVLAGRGGLNISHSKIEDRFDWAYGDAADVLRSAYELFDLDALVKWCESLGEPTTVGSSGRLFPASFKAVPLLRAWLAKLEELGVDYLPRHALTGLTDVEGGWSVGASTPNGAVELKAKNVVLALGGASWPGTGSTGTWAEVLKEHADIVPFASSNVAPNIEWSTVMRSKFAGTPLKNIAVAATAGGLAHPNRQSRGDVVITDGGLEGGPVYALTRELRAALSAGESASLFIDLRPDMSDAKLGKLFASRRPKDSIATWLRRCRLSPVEVNLLRDVTSNAIPDDPFGLADLVKAVEVPVTSLQGTDRAISTAGGVSLSSVDAGLQLKKAPGVYVIGEMLDWEAPTGGFLLHGVLATAVLAVTVIE